MKAQFSLSEERQKYIWHIEHLAFLLGQDVLPVFRGAIKEAHGDPLLNLLASEFKGRLFSAEGDSITRGLVTLETWEDARHPLREVDREAFAQELVSIGKTFETVKSVSIHITALSPEVDGELEGPWTSAWNLRVIGSREGGNPGETILNLSLTFARLSEETISEAGWIEGISVNRARTLQAPRLLMEEITDTTGIDVQALADNWKLPGPPYYPVTGGGSLLDFNRDGRIDLLLYDTKVLFLYRGTAEGTFEDVTRTAGLSLVDDGQVGKALVADLDGDGFEDLLLSVMAGRQYRTEIYQNRGDGTFRRLGPSEHNLQSYRMQFYGVADYDGDGRVDLYLAKSGKSSATAKEKGRWIGDVTSDEGVLLRNLGGWKFEDVTEQAGLAGENVDTLAVVWLDLEPDGDPDLFLANHMGTNVLWENRGEGLFVKRPMPDEFGGFSMGATAGDLDGDGDPDLYLANMYSAAGARVMGNLRPEDYWEGVFDLIKGFVTGNELYENRGAEGLSPVGVSAGVANSGWSYGPAVVDLDGDGRLDLYAPAGFQSVRRGDPDG